MSEKPEKTEETKASEVSESSESSEAKASGKKKKKRSSRKSRVLYIIAICILSSVMVFSLYKIAAISMEYRAGEEEYGNIADSYIEDYQTYAIPPKRDPVVLPDPPMPGGDENTLQPLPGGADTMAPSDGDVTAPPSGSSPSDDAEVVIVPKVNIEYLKYKNPDFHGWLYLDGTALNYPVVQGSDNEYYLDHTFYGKKNSSGCLFLDYRLDLSADNYNTVFYGHNMKNGTMFALLKKYARQDYYESHKYIIYVTEQGPYLIRVFSAYTISAKSDSWKMAFADAEEYSSWLNTITSASEIDTGIVPGADDRVVTLSTCTFVYDNARFVVHGIIEPLF